jgi:hypothetical protein
MNELHAWIERVRACIRNPQAHRESCPACSGTSRMMVERRRVSAVVAEEEDESDG